MLRNALRLAVVALLAAPLAARAETYTKDTYPIEELKRPLTLPAGMIEVSVPLTIELSKDVAFKAYQLGVGAMYGVDDKLSVGFSTGGLTLCTESPNNCKALNDFSLEGRYSLLSQKGLDAALQASLGFGSFDPSVMGLAVGVDLRAVQGQFALRAGPKLGFTFVGRDKTLYRETLVIPLEGDFEVSHNLLLGLYVDIRFTFDPPDPYGIGDTLMVPIGVGAVYAVSNKLDIFGSFFFSNLRGKDAFGDAAPLDGRTLTIGARFRL